jgi:hypothetical protein
MLFKRSRITFASTTTTFDFRRVGCGDNDSIDWMLGERLLRLSDSGFPELFLESVWKSFVEVGSFLLDFFSSALL